MEDGIERMMTSELYNIHFLNENKYKNEKMKKNIVKESIVKTPNTTTKNENELKLKDTKESTNSQ